MLTSVWIFIICTEFLFAFAFPRSLHVRGKPNVLLMLWWGKKCIPLKGVPLSQSLLPLLSSAVFGGCRYICSETIPAAQSLIKQLVDNYFIYSLLLCDMDSCGFQARMHQIGGDYDSASV